MTSPTLKAPTSRSNQALPDADSLVLQNRPLREGTDIARLSRFRDPRWDLAPGVFEEHHPAVSLGFDGCPPCYLASAMTYIWLLINTNEPVPLRRSGGSSRIGLITISVVIRRLVVFLDFLDARGVTELRDVTPTDYDAFLAQLREAKISLARKEDLVTEVRRLWTYRMQLPARDALPEAIPWQGDDTQSLVGRRAITAENATHRIAEQVINPLLSWSIHFVEDFAEDIISAFDEYKTLARRNAGRQTAVRRTHRHPPAGRNRVAAERWLQELRDRGDALPGKRDSQSGELRIDWAHVTRVLQCSAYSPQSEARKVILSCDLPVGEGAALATPIDALLDGQPWLNRRMRYLEAEPHARRLATACLIIVSYLSGMRTGEVLSLKRGCASHDPDTGLWLLRGTTWKGAKDEEGSKLAHGLERKDPWVVVELVGRAVSVLERLHSSDLLIPCLLDEGRYPTTTRAGKGRLPAHIARDMLDFVGWVNHYCEQQNRTDVIPADPHGNLNGSRFRRTLAWHLYRRPRGLVAGALQYGHVRTQMFLGYAGNYASGFPDETAMVEFLMRLEEVEDNAKALDAGEAVSGPAADRYRDRVQESQNRFAGRVLRTNQAARAVFSNPALQVFPGHGVTCVFDASRAQCESPPQGDVRATPTLSDCRPNCGNIARTDRDIAVLESDIERLAERVNDTLSPIIRHRREVQQMAALRLIVDGHQHARTASADKEEP